MISFTTSQLPNMRRRFSDSDISIYQFTHAMDEVHKNIHNRILEENRREKLITQHIASPPTEYLSTDNGKDSIVFVCISDTHSQHQSVILPPGDILLHAGDFTYSGTEQEVRDFNDWLGKQPFKYRIVIAGNHEVTFHRAFYDRNWKRWHKRRQDIVDVKTLLTNCIYLEDSEVVIDGVRIWGTPWQPWFLNWAFNLNRGNEIQKRWDLIPDNTDILLVHGPPLNHGDHCTSGETVGCADLLKTIERKIKPKHVVCGHVHEGYGSSTDDTGTIFYHNASVCTHDYRVANAPIIFNLKKNVRFSRSNSVNNGVGEHAAEVEYHDLWIPSWYHPTHASTDQNHHHHHHHHDNVIAQGMRLESMHKNMTGLSSNIENMSKHGNTVLFDLLKDDNSSSSNHNNNNVDNLSNNNNNNGGHVGFIFGSNGGGGGGGNRSTHGGNTVFNLLNQRDQHQEKESKISSLSRSVHGKSTVLDMLRERERAQNTQSSSSSSSS